MAFGFLAGSLLIEIFLFLPLEELNEEPVVCL